MIVAAAIRYEGIVLTGVRHSNIIRDIHHLFEEPDKTKMEQGFITHTNQFMNRYQAHDHVLECRQKCSPDVGVLTSEDLW